MPHTATILRAAGKNDKFNKNQQVKDWDNATPTPTTGFFQPFAGQENEIGGDVQIGDGVIYLPLSADVTGSDRITVLGDTYEVVGPPERWDTGSILDHQRARLKLIQR